MKEKIKEIKNYLKIVKDFKLLNRYIYLSSVFINKVEEILCSDMSEETKIFDIEVYYADFKSDLEEKEISNGLTVSNPFDTSKKIWP